MFPCLKGSRVINLYGRSLTTAFPHRFLHGSKGGLYAWDQVQQCPEVILVEGLFDYAVLWQAGFYNVTCAMGSHLNAHQYGQLCDCPRTVHLAFDADTNGSGEQAEQALACRLRQRRVQVRRIALPEGQFIAQDVSYDVGGHREGAQDPRIVNNRLLRKEILPMFDKATDMAHFYSPTWQAMRDEVTRVQDALLLKQMTPAQGAKELQTKLQAILDDYWSKKK